VGARRGTVGNRVQDAACVRHTKTGMRTLIANLSDATASITSTLVARAITTQVTRDGRTICLFDGSHVLGAVPCRRIALGGPSDFSYDLNGSSPGRRLDDVQPEVEVATSPQTAPPGRAPSPIL
jgi:hypothetical protein